VRFVIPILLSSVVVAERLPLIDVHLHAPAAGREPICAQPESWPSPTGQAPCSQKLTSPATDDLMLDATLRHLEEWNTTAITSGPPDQVDRWKRAGGKRIIPALGFRLPDKRPIDVLRGWFLSGRFAVLGEVTNQYNGIAPDDPLFEPYLALAEELDIPVGIHMGTGPPGAPYLGQKTYRARLGDPFLLEEVLIRHPKLRVYVMHAGWPLVDAMIAMLHSHPQLYVDTGVISWAAPTAEFYRHLKRLVESGHSSRVMFGSDQMSWPDAIPIAIEAVESAPFLTPQQKRDILFNNAARFFKLSRSSAPE
jgi:uncharacterized protein